MCAKLLAVTSWVEEIVYCNNLILPRLFQVCLCLRKHARSMHIRHFGKVHHFRSYVVKQKATTWCRIFKMPTNSCLEILDGLLRNNAGNGEKITIGWNPIRILLESWLVISNEFMTPKNVTTVCLSYRCCYFTVYWSSHSA